MKPRRNLFSLVEIDNDTISAEELDDHDQHSAEDVEDEKIFVFGIILIIVCFLGLIGNTLSVIVLCRKEMRGSIIWLIIGLLLCDSCYLICSLGIDGFPTMLVHLLGSEIYVPENSFAIEAAAQTGSIYFTIAISVERFIVVLYPLKARAFCTHSNSKMACIFVLVFSAMLGLTYYFLYRGSYFMIGDAVLAGFQFIIPIVLLAFLNLQIYRAVETAAAVRVNLTQTTRAELSITKMLLAVVLVFGITYIPLLMEFIFYHYNRTKRVLVEDADSAEIKDPGNTNWEYIPIVARLSVSLNCSVNFIIYCVAGTKFRSVVMKMWGQFTSCELCKNTSNTIRLSVRNLIRISE